MTRTHLKLAIFDIDGTLRRVRDPWIHLHNHLGVAEQARDFPARWQRGEISYEEWAQLDASLWRGYTHERLVTTLEANPFRAGATDLVDWFRSRSIPCVGISSGLSIFNDITARELGLKEVISNELHFDSDICSGGISIQVNEANKAEIMDEMLERYAVTGAQVVAFGDGTADIPLLTKAGLGVAICPSNDKVRSCVDQVVGAEPIDRAIAFVEKHFRIEEGR
jgi:phosphoserine phosphatase